MAGEHVPDADQLRILVCTDTHIGYNEKDKVRGSDALNTFEEILQLGKSQNADMILHGGDLFHDNKPSRGCIYRTMDLLRKYCFGGGDVKFDVVSDPSLVSREIVNTQDPDLNVEKPFFMIHGNHDDPGGECNLSVASLLSMAGLVNYFGRAEDLENIEIKPLLFVKGRTRVAVYGLGNIRDERLNRAFRDNKVHFKHPPDKEKWFHIGLIHQNRFKGNKGGAPTKACVHDAQLPPWLNLVIWGHEHDCQIDAVESLAGEFYIVQPGSSVATSLTPGETQLKHCCVVEVQPGSPNPGDSRHVFRIMKQPLYSMRPMAMKDVSLAETGILRTDNTAVWNFLSSEVNALIHQALEDGRERQRRLLAERGATSLPMPHHPLVRLRVEHSGFEAVAGHAFGREFIDKVANPDDILLFHKKGTIGKAAGSRTAPVIGDMLEIEEGDGIEGAQGERVKIQDIIYRYIDGEQNLQILSEPDLNDAVQAFVHRQEPCAIEQFVREAVAATNDAILKESAAMGEEEIRVQMQGRAEGLRQARLNAADSAATGPPPGGAVPKLDTFQEPQLPPPAAGGGLAAASSADVFGPVDVPASGRGRGRGGRGGRGGGGRGSKRAAASQDVLDPGDPFGAFPAPKAPRGRGGRGASSRASAATAAPAAAAAAAGGGGDQSLSLKERIFGTQPGAGGNAGDSLAPAAAAAPQPTPFLRPLGAAANTQVDALFGGTGALADGGLGNPPSQPAQPAPARRNWALRGT
eukprot:TRINITY_DN2607_c2_g1_i1.p1 TRINITY_DN2607_c2_g1~~TRINITY_DN2607_c2_g1_i1.p1  ORF type:complete len:748 (-),score=155.66 TRINITY_DN2607_c2_g1_i1:343-2586(-)